MASCSIPAWNPSLQPCHEDQSLGSSFYGRKRELLKENSFSYYENHWKPMAPNKSKISNIARLATLVTLSKILLRATGPALLSFQALKRQSSAPWWAPMQISCPHSMVSLHIWINLQQMATVYWENPSLLHVVKPSQTRPAKPERTINPPNPPEHLWFEEILRFP